MLWSWLVAPEVYAIIPCDVDISNCVFEAVIMVFGWSGVGLRKFDTLEGNIWVACCHCPNQLTNACFIVHLHLGGEAGLFLGVVRSDGSVELLDPGSIGGKWSRANFCHLYLVEPSVKVFLTEFVDIGMAVDFDVVAVTVYT